MERILYVVSGAMVLGGTESMIMNYYRHFDKQLLQIDFVCYGNEKGAFDKEILTMGGRIFHLPSKRQNLKKNIVGLYKICRENQYTVIHVHMDAMSFIPLLIARFAGVKVRICHCHSTHHLYNSRTIFILKELFRKGMRVAANVNMTCSAAAGDWFFGKNKYTIINNAIDIEQFKYDPAICKRVRKEYKLGNMTIFGHVGNFQYPKNQEFLLYIFQKYHAEHKNSKLLIIGDGEDRSRLEELAISLNIKKEVQFLGRIKNVYELIQCFDVFLLTSIFEGFPVVALEAQAAGIPCIFADGITRECKIMSEVEFCSLTDDESHWLEYMSLFSERSKYDTSVQIKNAGFDIRQEALRLQKIYLKLIGD